MKCVENSAENMHTDVRVEKLQGTFYLSGGEGVVHLKKSLSDKQSHLELLKTLNRTFLCIPQGRVWIPSKFFNVILPLSRLDVVFLRTSVHC